MTMYKINDKVIWLASARREGQVKRYSLGTIKKVYSQGVVVVWDSGLVDMISFDNIGFSMPLYSEFQESQKDLESFQTTIKPLFFGSCYPLKPNKDFEVLSLVKNMDRHHKNKKSKNS